jgi:hypothetical protein
MKLLSIFLLASILLGSTDAKSLSRKRHGGAVIATVVNNTNVSMSGSIVLYNTSTNQIYARGDFNIPEGANYDGFPTSAYFGDNVNIRINWNLAHGPVLPMGYMADISFLPGQTPCESINYSGNRTYATAIDGGIFTFNFYEQPICQ